ncbi:hypothetical protein COCMIDRAFT_30805 [Bipolaris oryzae ATCC 44560]|uniref:Uncharacterized protein n=1 Tax=Bipolaris oryzae ATCC 44560 TaxID=930090 RepID=W6YRV4_COCMI|nr:uncharacterized protein COCMIDRAFT_30805 [Bipolaris oryzae ATCC 44560]EUC40218.1 hypothetical protein COCMIDRAFT_30805 [Bipolaris oryzae ATCC 44560]
MSNRRIKRLVVCVDRQTRVRVKYDNESVKRQAKRWNGWVSHGAGLAACFDCVRCVLITWHGAELARCGGVGRRASRRSKYQKQELAPSTTITYLPSYMSQAVACSLQPAACSNRKGPAPGVTIDASLVLVLVLVVQPTSGRIVAPAPLAPPCACPRPTTLTDKTFAYRLLT